MSAPGTGHDGDLQIQHLHVGDRARVVGYRERSSYTDRLIRLGLIPGTLFTLERRAPLGDPVEIRFRGYSLVLRPSEAAALELESP
jgi:ferrous iron transport protein A